MQIFEKLNPQHSPPSLFTAIVTRRVSVKRVAFQLAEQRCASPYECSGQARMKVEPLGVQTVLELLRKMSHIKMSIIRDLVV